jgi:hypothetical protein
LGKSGSEHVIISFLGFIQQVINIELCRVKEQKYQVNYQEQDCQQKQVDTHLVPHRQQVPTDLTPNVALATSKDIDFAVLNIVQFIPHLK